MGKPMPSAKSGKKRIFISLRFLASLASASLVAISVIVVMGVNEQNMRKTLVQSAQTQLVLESRNLAITSSDAMLSEFPELTLVPLVKDMLDHRPEIQNVVITDHKGKIQGSRRSRDVGITWRKPQGLTPIVGAIPLNQGERLSESNHIILVECPIRYGNDSQLGWVSIIMDKSYIEAAIRQALIRMMIIAAGLLLAAIFLTTVVMSNMFRPISVLREGLERIGRGELDSPMQIRDFTELGLLADTVNTMAVQLKTSQNLAQAREQEVIDTQKEIINTLGQVVESRSTETANHTFRVGDMSYILASLAGLSQQEAELIRVASPMHDVGKIGIPDKIMNKPGKLTADEYGIMKTHAIIGFSIMSKSDRPIFKAAAIIAHQHHERWDGNGYPRQLRGEDIHIYGRIVGLVDVFDAIFSDRIYRKAMSLEQALKIMREESGGHFDPRLVDLFLDNLPKFLAISEQYSDGHSDHPAHAVDPQTSRDNSQYSHCCPDSK